MEMLSSIQFGAMILNLVIGAALGLAAGIVVAAIAGKIGLFRRRSKAHNAFAKLYYLYLPLLGAFLFTAWMALSTTQTQLNSAMASARPTVTSLSTTGARLLLVDLLARESGKDLTTEGMMQSVRTYVDNGFVRIIEYCAPALQVILKPMQGAVSSALSDAVGQRLAQAAGGRVGLSSLQAASVWEQGVMGSLKNGLVMDVIQGQVNKRFDSYRASLLLLGAILLLPVLLEILISKARGRKKPPAGA